MVTSTSLVYNSTKRSVSSVDDEVNDRRLPIWSTKQRRAYHRIMSGYKFALFPGKRLRFMTLTTSIEGRDNDIGNDFKNLIRSKVMKYQDKHLFPVKRSIPGFTDEDWLKIVSTENYFLRRFAIHAKKIINTC